MFFLILPVTSPETSLIIISEVCLKIKVTPKMLNISPEGTQRQLVKVSNVELVL